jgi:hypothetical protein
MDSSSRPLTFLLLLVSGWVNRQQQAVIAYLLEENRILRAEHASRRVRLTDDQRRRLAVKGVVLGRRRLADVSGIVTPETILRWYRRLIAQKYDGSRARRRGRPSTKPDIAALVVRMAKENPAWGYTRIRGGLKSLGHEVARNTIKAILKDHGIAPAPERGTNTPWKTFLAAHWDGLAAADSFTVEVLTLGGLVRYSVFFVMKLKMRRGDRRDHVSAGRGLDDTARTEPARCQRRLPPRRAAPRSGPRSALLHRVSAPAAGERRETTPAARAQSEFERVCRAVRLVRQVRVLGPHRATR